MTQIIRAWIGRIIQPSVRNWPKNEARKMLPSVRYWNLCRSYLEYLVLIRNAFKGMSPDILKLNARSSREILNRS